MTSLKTIGISIRYECFLNNRLSVISDTGTIGQSLHLLFLNIVFLHRWPGKRGGGWEKTLWIDISMA